jgi:NAD(P)-dependent dehydrogenase (short-subunit alcohol dehydrogenase family)
MSSYLENLFSLKDQVAVVSGGTGELCGAMAEGLAGAGAFVYLLGRSEEKAKAKIERIESLGGRGAFLPFEATDRSSVELVLETVMSQQGKVDILVNGAGGNSATPYLEISDEEFRSIVDLNIRSVFVACQAFGKRMIDLGNGGSIINVGSMSGLIPLSRVFTYSLTKAAVHNLSKNLAREWAPHNIRVNTIVPGFFPAEQNRKVLTPDRVEKIMGHTPMNRFGDAEELIGATLLLASRKAGSFITGEELVVDGGYASMTI